MSRGKMPLYAIGAFRMVGGLSTWVAPKLLARTYGADALEDDLLVWSRMASSRETALAVGPLISDGEGRRSWLILGLACDVADMAATMAGNRDRLGRGTALALTTYTVSALLTARALEPAGRRE